MNIWRSLRCALVLHMMWLLTGCCTEEYTFTVKYEGIAAINLDNSGAGPVASAGGTIPAKAYGIRMKLEDSTIVLSGTSPTSSTDCPAIHRYVDCDTIRSLRIHLLTADPAIPPADVTDDFRIRINSGGSLSESFISVPRLLERLAIDPLAAMPQVDLLRIENALPSATTRFIVTVGVSDGTTFADTTEAVELI